ncbi:MAG: hypothetical protein WCF67_03785 [Chitinophagaceae bacterium]
MEFPLEYYFIALSMIVGFATLMKNSRAYYLRLFPFFLLLALISEMWAWRLGMKNINNIGIYNFFSVIAFIFYMYVLRYVVFSKKAKKIILFVMIVYAIVSLSNILFIQKIDTFHTITYSLGCFLLIVISIYYFYELFQVPRSINLRREPAFWIVAGLLFFYSCTLPILGIVNYMPNAIAFSLGPIIKVLNVLLYSLFTIAFVCRMNLRSMS